MQTVRHWGSLGQPPPTVAFSPRAGLRRYASLGLLRRNRDRDRARHRRLTRWAGDRRQGEAMVPRRERRRDDDKLARLRQRSPRRQSCPRRAVRLSRSAPRGRRSPPRLWDRRSQCRRRAQAPRFWVGGLIGRSRSAWRGAVGRDSRRGRKSRLAHLVRRERERPRNRRDWARENPDGAPHHRARSGGYDRQGGCSDPNQRVPRRHADGLSLPHIAPSGECDKSITPIPSTISSLIS